MRSVFDTCDTWRKEALQALSTLADLNALNDAVGKVRVNPKALDRLIHLEVDTDSFTAIQSIIGSDLIAEKIAQQLCSKKVDDVIAFLSDSRGYGSLAPLSGHLFEAVVHLLLKKGGRFTVKCLDDSSSAATVDFPRKNREIIFHDISFLDLAENGYARPLQKNYPSIDSLLILDSNISLISIANSQNHDLKDKGLRLVHSHFHASHYNLYIAIPDFRLAQWRDHPPLHHSVDCNLTQFLLSIHLNSLRTLVYDAPLLDLDKQAKKQKLQALMEAIAKRLFGVPAAKTQVDARTASASNT